MKSFLKIFITLVAFAQLSLVASAQTQTGIVKTKGRLGANGSVIAGTRLPGASVKVQGRNAVLSNKNGIFTFPVPGQRFSLISASKTGYVLTDPDILMRQHTYSGQNPVFVVMETPETQLEDQLASERKIRRNLSQKLAAREQEIEQLKNENKITKQEYQKLMQELYANQESNEKLIKDMAKRYASMDYDQLDDLNRRVQAYILDGNLIAADSLINSKGDIVTRANNIKREQKLIAAEKKELTERLKVVSQLETGSNLDIEDIAKDCMHKAEIHKFNLRNDSAGFYLELRADLDTLNADWQMDAAEFNGFILADYQRAFDFLGRASAIAKQTNNKSLFFQIYKQYGNIYTEIGQLTKAEEYLTKALDYGNEIFETDNVHTVRLFCDLGILYREKGDNQRAFDIYQHAFDIAKRLIVEYQSNDKRALTLEETAVFSIFFNDFSVLLGRMGILFPHAIQISLIAKKIISQYYSDDSFEMVYTYNTLGHLYKATNEIDKAKAYLSSAYKINLKNLGENHPAVAIQLSGLAEVLARTGDFNNAIQYATQAIHIFSSRYGDSHSTIGELYHNLGLIYYRKGEYSKAIHHFEKAIDIFVNNYGSQHPRISEFYENIAVAYEMIGDVTFAQEYRAKAEVAKDSFVEQLKSSINEEKLIQENTIPLK